jgi:hypothetical protein
MLSGRWRGYRPALGLQRNASGWHRLMTESGPGQCRSPRREAGRASRLVEPRLRPLLLNRSIGRRPVLTARAVPGYRFRGREGAVPSETISRKVRSRRGWVGKFAISAFFAAGKGGELSPVSASYRQMCTLSHLEPACPGEFGSGRSCRSVTATRAGLRVGVPGGRSGGSDREIRRSPQWKPRPG